MVISLVPTFLPNDTLPLEYHPLSKPSILQTFNKQISVDKKTDAQSEY